MCGRGAYFMQLWTLKEAYVKALGRGISAPPGLRSFSFRVQAAAGAGAQPQAAGQEPPPPQLQQEQQQQQRHKHHHRAWLEKAPEQQQHQAGHASAHAPQPAYAQALPGSALGGGAPQAGSHTSSITEAHQSSSSGSSTWSGSSESSAHAVASIQFSSAVPERRSWQFMLLQPSAGHVAALCVEQAREHAGRPLRLSCFEAGGLADDYRAISVQPLGQGSFLQG